MASLFSKPNSIVYVRRSGLIIAGKQIKPARLNFPNGVVRNLEVISHRKYLGGCQAFFEDHQAKGKRVLIVLDQSLVFETQADDLDAFVDAMPFAAGQRACTQLPGTEVMESYATNYELYDGIRQALQAAGAAKIIAITPAAAYHLAPEEKLASAIELFISDTVVRGQANFASSRPL